MTGKLFKSRIDQVQDKRISTLLRNDRHHGQEGGIYSRKLVSGVDLAEER